MTPQQSEAWALVAPLYLKRLLQDALGGLDDMTEETKTSNSGAKAVGWRGKKRQCAQGIAFELQCLAMVDDVDFVCYLTLSMGHDSQYEFRDILGATKVTDILSLKHGRSIHWLSTDSILTDMIQSRALMLVAKAQAIFCAPLAQIALGISRRKDSQLDLHTDDETDDTGGAREP